MTERDLLRGLMLDHLNGKVTMLEALTEAYHLGGSDIHYGESE